MCRTFTHGTKVRLSFSDRPNAPVNIADSMENAGSCSWIQRGDGSHEELQGFAKPWRTKYRRVQRSKHAIPCFFSTDTSSILSAMFTGACGPPEKLGFTLMPCSYILYMIVKLTYCEKQKKTQFTFHGSFYHPVLCISVTWAPMQTYASCYTISIPLYFLFNYF